MLRNRRLIAFALALLLAAAWSLPAAAAPAVDKTPQWRIPLFDWMLESVAEWVARIGPEAEPDGSPTTPEGTASGAGIEDRPQIGPEAEPNG